jgi:transposase
MGGPGSEDLEPGLWRVTFALSGGKDVTPRWLQPANKSLRPRLSFARLLRGEPLGLVARTNVSIARLTEWRERALAGVATALKERECDDSNDEIARLKSKVGEITMDNELLYAKIAALEGKRPLAHRRPRR